MLTKQQFIGSLVLTFPLPLLGRVLENAGAVYVFEGTVDGISVYWARRDYVKASNTEAFDASA